MKKLWSILLICFLSAASFGALLHNCPSCTSTQSTHCKPDVSQTQYHSSCHDTAPVEKKSCCPSEKQTTPDDCQICSDHDQPTATEKIVDTHIKSKFQFEGIVAQANFFPTIVTPEKNPTILKLRSSPLISSLTFLKTIRLLC
jgi:hypothetical protein